MPIAAPTACKEPRCPHPAVERGRCAMHRRSTSERGYGTPHQRERARRLRLYRPSDPCPRCGGPLGADVSAIDLGHGPGQVGYSGLEHARCNRSARGNA